MTDRASDYPSALDGTPPTLEDEHDFVPADALEYAKNIVAAINGEVGNDPVRFASLGSIDFGTIAAFLLAISRKEVGEATTTTVADFDVTFTAGRFTEPPFVILQRVDTSSPGDRAFYYPKRVTSEGFVIGMGHASPKAQIGGSAKTISWFAIQAPFGVEEAVALGSVTQPSSSDDRATTGGDKRVTTGGDQRVTT